MNKVTLPKMVAHNVDMLRLVNESNADIMRIALGVRGDMSPELQEFAKTERGLNTLIDALSIGYEAARSPEEEVRDCMREWSLQRDGIRKIGAVLHVLNTLDIKIAGVNDGC